MLYNNSERKRSYGRQYYRFYKHLVKRYQCTLSHDENGRLLYYSGIAGMKPTPFLKKAAFAYLDQRFLVSDDLDFKLHKLIVILRNIGTNINQIAKQVNTRKQTVEADILKLQKLVYHLEDQVTLFIRNPHKEDAHPFNES